MKLEQKLEQFGLDEKKARIYLAALELGTAKAFDIAKKAGVERSTTYDILQKLSQEGLVGFYEKRGIRYYVAEDPVKIRRALEEKERALDLILPELRSLHNSLLAKPRIRYHEGVAGIKTVLEDTLTTESKTLNGILSMIDLLEIPGKSFMDRYVEQRIKSRIRLRVIRSRPKEVAEYWPTDPQAFRALRYAPEGMVFAMTMYVYDHKVVLIASQRENFGMIIESEEFSENMQNLFTALWQVSQSDR